MAAALAANLPRLQGQDASRGARDEQAWKAISESFPVDRSILNFNHAAIGSCPPQVIDSVVKRTWAGEKAAPNTIFSYGLQMEPIRAGSRRFGPNAGMRVRRDKPACCRG